MILRGYTTNVIATSVPSQCCSCVWLPASLANLRLRGQPPGIYLLHVDFRQSLRACVPLSIAVQPVDNPGLGTVPMLAPVALAHTSSAHVSIWRCSTSSTTTATPTFAPMCSGLHLNPQREKADISLLLSQGCMVS